MTKSKNKSLVTLLAMILLLSLFLIPAYAENIEVEAYYDTSINFPNGWNEEDSFSGSLNAKIEDGNLIITPTLSVSISSSSEPKNFNETDLLEQGHLITSNYWNSFVSIGLNGGELGFTADQVVNGDIIIPIDLLSDYTSGDDSNLEIYFFHRVPHKNPSYDIVASQRIWGETTVKLQSDSSEQTQPSKTDTDQEQQDSTQDTVINEDYVNLISFTKGMVQIKRAGTDQLIRARHRMPIGPGDKIYTSQNSSCELIGPKTVITLKDQSSFTVLGERLKAEKNSKFRVIFKDVEETFNNFFTPENYEVETPTNIIGIRGTDFIVTVGNNGETEILLREGEIEATNKYSNQKALVYSGEKLLTQPNDSTFYMQQLTKEELDQFTTFNESEPINLKLDETNYTGEVGDGVSYVITPNESGEYEFYHEAQQRTEEDSSLGMVGSDIADRVILNIYDTDNNFLKSSYDEESLYRDQAAYEDMMRNSEESIDYKQLSKKIVVELHKDSTYYLYVEPAYDSDIGRQYLINASFIGPLEEDSFSILPFIFGLILILILLTIIRKIINRKKKVPAKHISSQDQSYCTNCGTPVKNRQTFCPNCGTKLKN